ncbi:recombinase family protein [Streptomyces sp. NPDC005009]
MERDDRPALRALGFDDAELKELGLWEPATGDPASLAEMYIRRSKKKDTLSSLKEQVRRMCHQAEKDDIRIRHVWFEQKSASKSYIRREEFEKATAAIVGGLSKTLYVFKTSRLSRRGMGQVGLLLDKFEERQARIYVVAESIDSTNSRMILAILSEQAREQAADISQFTKLGIDANKAEGRYAGGVTPYGLRAENGKLVHHAAEYPTARRIADYLLEGKTPNWIAEKLNSEETPTRHGRKWGGPGIISLAHAVTWAGVVAIREKMVDENGKDLGKYRRGGKPMLDKDGHPVSMGQGVITFAEHVKIAAKLAERAQPGTAIGNRARGKRQFVVLASGLMTCGRCGRNMVNGGNNYRCYARKLEGPSSCQGVSATRARVDDALASMWLSHVLSLSPDSPTIHEIARGWLSYQDPDKEARKAHVSAALESAVSREMQLQKERFILNRISEATYEYLWRELNEQIARLKGELAELSKEADLSPLMNPESLAELWKDAGIGGQRALLRAALKGIKLLPSKHRGDKTPIIDRLVPEWRDSNHETRIDSTFDAWERGRTQQ